jgi:hypothetical protein
MQVLLTPQTLYEFKANSKILINDLEVSLHIALKNHFVLFYFS